MAKMWMKKKKRGTIVVAGTSC